jgi:cbb3-type cytochrome oxidase subunit 1
MAYLVVAMVLGVALVARPATLGPAAPAHVHLLVVGWLTQLIFGVAYWLFPRFSKERPYGNVRLAAATYALLNVGLIVRLAAEPAVGWGGGPGWRAALVAAATLQGLGAITFAAYLWPRVRTR